MKKIESLATFFVEKSLEIKPGDRVFVKYKNGILTPLVEEVIKKSLTALLILIFVVRIQLFSPKILFESRTYQRTTHKYLRKQQK